MTSLYRNGISKLNERHFRLNVKEYTIYVEGDKDVLFWNEIFPQENGWKPRVEVLKNEENQVIGGWKNLINYLETKIQEKSKINFIIAIDGDYNFINHYKHSYDNVVMTKRYSLENYIFCPNSINRCMNILSYGLFNDLDYVSNKLQKFVKIIKNLVILDVINNKKSLGLSVYGLEQQQLTSFNKIKSYVTKMTKDNVLLLNRYYSILDNYNIIDYVRWKFFLKKIINIITKEVNRVIQKENNIRKNNPIRILRQRKEDELYTYCIKNCSQCINICEDYKLLLEQAKSAFEKTFIYDTEKSQTADTKISN